MSTAGGYLFARQAVDIWVKRLRNGEKVMTQSNSTLIGLHSEWVESSEMRCSVRRGKGRILVDVTELSPNQITHKQKALRIARKLAVLNGAIVDGATELVDVSKDRRTVRFKTDEEAIVRARQMVWAFKVVKK